VFEDTLTTSDEVALDVDSPTDSLRGAGGPAETASGGGLVNGSG
jgi:hypothetical protein